MARAFTLIELMVVITVGAVLIALTAAGVSSVSNKAKQIKCLSRMRNLGIGILTYCQDNGEFPRSLHSAAGAGVQPWGKAILPYLDLPSDPTDAEWKQIFNTYYHCPADKTTDPNIWSAALNVYFELDPGGDDYDGSPTTWRTPASVSCPGRTILLAEPKPVYYADHIMCHLWTTTKAASNAIDSSRHGKTSNFLFVDGHVESLPVEATFYPAKRINLWNPGLAGGN